MDIGAKKGNELLDVSDKVCEMKWPVGERHQARIDPIGDIDVVCWKQRAHGIAQERRVMAGEWRHE